MCSKRLRFTQRGDWVAALHLANGHPVDLHRYTDTERYWIARQLVDDHHWSVSRAANFLGFNVRTFANLETDLAVSA